MRELIAIDSFEGDSQTGKYGQSVERQFRAEVKARNDKRIRVIKARFEQAAVEFEAETISMLHIDGAHDFESVRQDFETWLPLMCRDGVIIFHDVAVKKKGFGVNRFWKEVTLQYPLQTITFDHSNGLGILFLNQF